MLRLALSVMVVFCVISLISVAYAQSYTGILQLDYISSKIKTGDTVVFSGQLTTTSGHVVPDAVIYIKDDVRFGGDDVIKKIWTDSNGEFYTTWTAKERSSGSWDFYAIFEGSSNVKKARSGTYNVDVSSSYGSNSNSNSNPDPVYRSTAITLHRIPSSVYAGGSITFTGQLTSNGYAVQGATIKIMEDDFGPDERLGYGTTDSNGKFSISWKAERGIIEDDFDVYAVFDGSSNYKKSRSNNQVMTVLSSEQTTNLRLDRIPSSVYVENSVTFTGQLTSNGYPVQGATIKIKEDDSALPDETLAIGRTDSNGWFSIPWKASAGTIEIDFDVYAIFEGNSNYKKVKTSNQQMSVLKYDSNIFLDSPPNSARIGDVIVFSGSLSLEGHSSENAIVYIKDEDPLNPDDLLATGYVDQSGHFSASWIVKDVDDDSVADIYAVFEGNNQFERSTTCTNSCTNNVKIRILDAQPYRPSPPTIPSGTEYMELYYSKSLSTTPKVAIVPDPDVYDKVRGHIVPVKEGILMWTSDLEHNYGGNWNVDFEVVSPNQAFFRTTPDVVVNLVTHNNEDGQNGCDDYFGIAYGVSIDRPSKTINTVVCSVFHGTLRSNVDVAATAAHEFIHAMGLGHTFNKKNDLMCSVEDGKPTCPPTYSKSKNPSRLNLAAVTKIYGQDGFTNPNNNIQLKEKFFFGSNNYNEPNPIIPQPKDTSYCERTYDNYDSTINRTLNSGWYLSWKICSEDISYSFATDNKLHGMMIFVLSPTTDVKDFMHDRNGKYYTCEEYEKTWHKKSNTCNIAPGSHIVISNPESNAINVHGYIKNK